MLENVKLVEIGIHNLCNRNCSWCSNRFIKKTSRKMNKVLFESTVLQLKSLGFTGAIKLSRFNEPLISIGLLMDYIYIVRKNIPKSKIIITTNGDYLTKDIIQEIDVDKITVIDYDNNDKGYYYQKFLNMGIKLNSDYDNKILYGKEQNTKISIHFDYPNSKKRNPKQNLKLKEKPCTESMRYIGIDVNGDVSLCRNVRSEIDEHKKYIIGNLFEDHLSDIYESPKAIDIQFKSIDGKFRVINDCTNCNKEINKN